MLLARLSVAAATPETVSISRHRATEALELARSTADPALVAQALAALNDAYAGPAYTMTRRDNADTIVELAVVAGDRVLELLGYRYRIVADLEVGDIAAVDRNIAAFTRLAEQLRQPLVSWYVPLFRGMRALLRGDLDGAERWCSDVALAAEATASHNAAMMAATLALGIDASRGRTPDPAALEGLFEVDPAEWASYAAGLALVRWLVGDRDRARHLLKLHADNGFNRLGEDGEQLTTLLMFGRVATGLEEAAPCEALYDASPTPCRSLGCRRDRRLLLGADRTRVGSARAGPRSASRRPRAPRPRPCQRRPGRCPAHQRRGRIARTAIRASRRDTEGGRSWST